MSKAPPKSPANQSGNIENEIREILRKFAREILNTQKLKDNAAKETDSKASYMRAVLNQRGVGGLSVWAPLIAYCFKTKGLDLTEELSRLLSEPNQLGKKTSDLTPSEQIFRNLNRISIVNEDVKFELAISLEKMLKNLEHSMDGNKKKK